MGRLIVYILSIPMVNDQASIQGLENQIGQLAKMILERPPGTLPSNTKPNLKEHVKAVTLRSGKEYKPPIPYLGKLKKDRMDAQFGILGTHGLAHGRALGRGITTGRRHGRVQGCAKTGQTFSPRQDDTRATINSRGLRGSRGSHTIMNTGMLEAVWELAQTTETFNKSKYNTG
ncbi:hypothetical protein GOBAR_AA09479 [Gossypium barbadense]|uniref:Uncharacterized protein n=1 Tax=Gossypium barbadense TaxID=3634 RepID=A0A2P5Y6F0_GOSBA|nr:hypothetical protein GOBAR_AA09479 [Gossypium barbadense]